MARSRTCCHDEIVRDLWHPCPLPTECRQSRQNNSLAALDVSKGRPSVIRHTASRHTHLVWSRREQAFVATFDVAFTQIFIRNFLYSNLRVLSCAQRTTLITVISSLAFLPDSGQIQADSNGHCPQIVENLDTLRLLAAGGAGASNGMEKENSEEYGTRTCDEKKRMKS